MHTLLRTKYILFTILSFGLFLTSCTLEQQIVGTWQVAEYSEVQVGGSSSSANNAGTIEFNSDGTGVNDIDYRIFGNSLQDKQRFTYDIGDNYVTIKPTQVADSVTAKSWIVMESMRSKQLWKSTDGEGSVQTLVLKKKD